jgi:hypothetical protein
LSLHAGGAPPTRVELRAPGQLPRVRPGDDLATLIGDGLVRDAIGLAAAGYRLTKLTAADFFPHTPHFEVLGFLERG